MEDVQAILEEYARHQHNLDHEAEMPFRLGPGLAYTRALKILQDAGVSPAAMKAAIAKEKEGCPICEAGRHFDTLSPHSERPSFIRVLAPGFPR